MNPFLYFGFNFSETMKIKIAGLSNDIHNLNFSGKTEQLELGDPFRNNYELKVRLDKSIHQLILDAELKVDAALMCDRCGAEFISERKINFEMVYLFGVEHDAAEEGSNVSYLPVDADKINISTELYDYSHLELPMKVLCKDDCKGLCLSCGKNLNEGECGCKSDKVDDRWLPLLDLKNKFDK